MAMFSRSQTPPPPPAVLRPPRTREDSDERVATVREKVHRRLLSELSPTIRTDNLDEVRRALERIFDETVAEERLPLSRLERNNLFEQVLAGILGYGPLEPFLRDDSVTEILVNGPNLIFLERNGKLEETDVRFRDTEDLMRIIDRIVSPLGRRVDESSPMVDARLPDGSRVNIIIPPLSLEGPCISIRKFARAAYSMEDVLQLGSLTKEMMDFLRVCVLARLNVVVSGATSTGKTTLLNALSNFIPNNERVITIEDAAELQLQQRHVVRLEARPPNIEGRGQITIRQLVINALRMRPDRIVVGEVRGGEALDMLQAMNTGHEGSLTTIHANDTRDALSRLEMMVAMTGLELPILVVRQYVAAGIHLVVHLTRLQGGVRKITRISEILSVENGAYRIEDIFGYRQTGVDSTDTAVGEFYATGYRPACLERIRTSGAQVPDDWFRPWTCPDQPHSGNGKAAPAP